MQQLEDLPVLVLELIVTFLDYSGHMALMQTNTYFKKLVEGLVIKEVVLPNNRICQFNLRKPVMRLIVNMPFDSNNVIKTNETLTDFAGELCQFNVVKTGDLTIRLASDNDAVWPAVTRIYYHLLMILILESKLQPNSIKRLEIQLDFLCDQCRKFLEKLPGILIFTSLERLKVNCINYNDTPTVGLYVHFLKMIFNFAPLKSFELSNIPGSIYEELRAWFLPGNMYFSQIRKFEFYTKPLAGNCLLFLFGDLLIENLH